MIIVILSGGHKKNVTEESMTVKSLNIKEN